jgi:uncharacterized membrane protein
MIPRSLDVRIAANHAAADHAAGGRPIRARRTFAYAALLVPCLLWTAGIYLPALTAATGHAAAWHSLLRLLYAPFCHQEAARCFHAGGVSFSVCHRCTAIYTAFTATVLLYPLLRRAVTRLRHAIPAHLAVTARWALVTALLPMALDVLFDVAGIMANTAASRCATGALAGAALALFTIPAILSLPITPRRASHECIQ